MGRTYAIIVEAALVLLVALTWAKVSQTSSRVTPRLRALAIYATLSPFAGLGFVLLSGGGIRPLPVILFSLAYLGGVASLVVIVALEKGRRADL